MQNNRILSVSLRREFIFISWWILLLLLLCYFFCIIVCVPFSLVLVFISHHVSEKEIFNSFLRWMMDFFSYFCFLLQFLRLSISSSSNTYNTYKNIILLFPFLPSKIYIKTTKLPFVLRFWTHKTQIQKKKLKNLYLWNLNQTMAVEITKRNKTKKKLKLNLKYFKWKGIHLVC